VPIDKSPRLRAERKVPVIPGATIAGLLSLDNSDPFIDDDEFAIDDPWTGGFFHSAFDPPKAHSEDRPQHQKSANKKRKEKPREQDRDYKGRNQEQGGEPWAAADLFRQTAHGDVKVAKPKSIR